CALSGPSTSVPLNLEKTHWSVFCAAMNFAVSCGAAVAASFFAAGGFGGISACAGAPGTLSGLIAAGIISVVGHFGLRSGLLREGTKPSLPGNNSRAQSCVPCIGNLAGAAANGFAHCKPVGRRRIGDRARREANRGRRDGTLIAGKGPRALTTD